MGIQRVVILGGGPVGLLCAIEARQQGFGEVTIIEKRGEYTRLNVPQLTPGLIGHLRNVDDEKKIKLKGETGEVPFKEIEPALLGKATSMGVKLMRPCVVRALAPIGKIENGRCRAISMMVVEWDQKTKAPMSGRFPRRIIADLLIIATGAGAAEDVIVKTLGFNYEILKPGNYMALGIFDPPGQLADEDEVPSDIQNAYDGIATQGGICFQTANYQYLLSSLSGISKADFKLLKENQGKLEELVRALKRVTVTTTGVREEIQNVANKVLAFRISIQRARQMASEKYPAVLVGDAAVTPHPDTGSGYTTGFLGFQEVKTLMAALARTSKPEDDAAAFMSFDHRYEVHVSEKALSGTVTVCDNNIGLLKSYRAYVQRYAAASGSSLRKAFDSDIAYVDKLIKKLEKYRDAATAYTKLYKNEKEALKGKWVDEGPAKLWAKLAKTWDEIHEITKLSPLLEPQLQALQRANGFV